MSDRLVVVRGGGDLGSGVALRLWRCGFRVAVLECLQPVAVRRTVSFAEAVYEGIVSVEEARSRLVTVDDAFDRERSAGEIAVVIDPEASILGKYTPFALVDAIMAKKNTGTRAGMAPLVVALGPGFTAGEDVHAVVETNRGPHLGRVIWSGTAELDTGLPSAVGDKTTSRVLRAPADGMLRAIRHIGDIVDENEAVAEVAGLPVRAGFRALLRGLTRDGLVVREGMKVGDIDPRLDPDLCRLVSDKSLAVAGGVLEAIGMHLKGRAT